MVGSVGDFVLYILICYIIDAASSYVVKKIVSQNHDSESQGIEGMLPSALSIAQANLA
jgi:hypothetical protein